MNNKKTYHLLNLLKCPKYCIFEEKNCKYAKNEDKCFQCICPSDYEMPCKEDIK